MRRPLMWFCILGIAVVFLITYLADIQKPPSDFQGEIIIAGRLYKKEMKNDRPVLYLKECSYFCQSSFEEDSQKDSNKIKGVICYLDAGNGISDYPIGSYLVLKGTPSKIRKATNPGEFDAYRYYRARGYGYYAFKPQIVSGSGGNKIAESLYILKTKGCGILLSAMGEEYGGVLCAILFGDKMHLSPELKDLFTDGGIAHILAISGLHISLIGAFLYAVLNHHPVPQKAAFIITVFVLVLYGFAVGFAPSVFRAIFMFSFRLLAKLLKKPYDEETSIALSAFLTCLFFPYMILDSSFQLSYLSVAGIIFIYPLFLPFVNRKKGRVDGLFIGLSVFIADLPVLIASFHQISLVSFLLNFFVLPAMPVLFVCAFGVILFWYVVYPISLLLSVICRAILFTFSYFAAFLTGLPFSTFCIKMPSTFRIVFYTTSVVLLCSILSSFRRKMKLSFYRIKNKYIAGSDEGMNSQNGKSTGEKKKALNTEAELELKGFRITENLYRAGVFFTFLFLCVFLLTTPKKAVITFLDVGQGDGIFIRTENKDVFMIDGGSSSKKEVGKNILEPYLKYEGEQEVDIWFLTHEDEDHISGFKEVLDGDEIRIHTVAVPYVLKDEFSEIVSLAEMHGTEVVYLKAGDSVGAFLIASPDADRQYPDSNAASFAILFQEGELSALFMGDSGTEAEEATEEYLKDYGDGRVEILKCAHHGSAIGSNSREFIAGITPCLAVISCGENNRYGHPHKETLENLEEAGVQVARTDELGAVSVSTKGKAFVLSYKSVE